MRLLTGGPGRCKIRRCSKWRIRCRTFAPWCTSPPPCAPWVGSDGSRAAVPTCSRHRYPGPPRRPRDRDYFRWSRDDSRTVSRAPSPIRRTRCPSRRTDVRTPDNRPGYVRRPSLRESSTGDIKRGPMGDSVRALDLRLEGREFDSRPPHYSSFFHFFPDCLRGQDLVGFRSGLL